MKRAVEMEGEEEMGLVLARASELKSKFFNLCLHRRNSINELREGEGANENEDEDENDGDGEARGLASIRDAFDALEQHLSQLQTLQQQQRYEREASLFQIDHSRKILVAKLKEYKGNNLEVIHEALTFAGGKSNTLNHEEDLLLPPYPTHLPPDLFVMDNLYSSSCFLNTAKDKLLTQNGTEEKQQNHHSCEPLSNSSPNSHSRNKPQGRIGQVFGFLAKSVLTFVGVASVLSLAGFRPMVIKKGSIQFKIPELFQRPGGGSNRETNAEVKEHCPPGKIMVIEDGQPRCLVKERVEIPFDLDVAAPKINYGFG